LLALSISQDKTLPILFIDANIHAREWISSAVAVWLINELLTNTDPAVRSIVDRITWIIIPVLNPDGEIDLLLLTQVSNHYYQVMFTVMLTTELGERRDRITRHFCATVLTRIETLEQTGIVKM
jgi:Zinc carboxypeptidase